MRILLIGEVYSTNLGDGVICNSVEYLLNSSFQDVEIIFADISGKTGYRTHSKRVPSIKKAKITSCKLKLSKLITRIGIDTEYYRFSKKIADLELYINQVCSQKIDVAIFAGGQMFKDSFVLPISKFVESLRKNNAPVLFNACGVGEIASKKMRNILSKALSKSTIAYISSRDDTQTINNRYLKNGELKAVNTYDPAIWSKIVYGIDKKASDTVGLGIMYAYNMDYFDMVRFWKGIIWTLERKGIKWKLFCNGTDLDYYFAVSILKSLGYSDNSNHLATKPQNPRELVELISSFKSIISFRLHSHVIAYSLGIPSVAIVWDEKLRYFFRSIGCEKRCKDIKTSPSAIISELDRAQIEGYDIELLKKQQTLSKELLVNAISRITENN